MSEIKDIVLGVDFGTTNSSAAIFNNGELRFFDLDDLNDNKKTLKSSIFISKDQEISIGRKALNEYIDKFENIEIKTALQYTDVKSISWQWEGSIFYDYVREEIELNSPGRLILSPKKIMPTRLFDQTEISGKIYTAEDLAEIILKEIKEKVERQLGHEIENINLGRPIHFSDNGEDNLAIERITNAAKRVGFKNITFTYEPIGAAYNYAQKNEKNKLGLVFDFGGGTFDTSVVEFNPDHTIKVLGNEGVYVGGNLFNEKLIFHKIMQYFGRDVLLGRGRVKMPKWIMESASKWEEAVLFRKKHNLDLLEEYRLQADRPELISNLQNLLKFNLGLSLFFLAEKAKIDLSKLENGKTYTKISWRKGNIEIDEFLNQEEFKSFVWDNVARITQSIRMVLEKTGKDYKDIEVIIKTGGSSRTFFIEELLKNLFPKAEIFTGDDLTDVTAGLAISGAQMLKT